MPLLTLDDIRLARQRIAPRVHHTPVVSSAQLNRRLGHEIFFKAECLQKVGAFKARGALNTLLWLREQGQLPPRVVAYSSGNHAQAVAWAAGQLGIRAQIVMPADVAAVKLQATRHYGAEVILCARRAEAEQQARQLAQGDGFLLPPYDHNQVICGQGTAALEALQQIGQPLDAVFAPCGGGGLLSGTLIAARGLQPATRVIGGEPLQANDAVRSLVQGHIFRWPNSPQTLADGARTLCVSERTLGYLRQLDDLLEIPEVEIAYWTQWLCHLLKLHCEPTAALGMAAAARWLRNQTRPRQVLVILSGGNMDPVTLQRLWRHNHLEL